MQAGNTSALFLAMTHEGALLLAVDQPQLLWCFTQLYFTIKMVVAKNSMQINKKHCT